MGIVTFSHTVLEHVTDWRTRGGQHSDHNRQRNSRLLVCSAPVKHNIVIINAGEA